MKKGRYRKLAGNLLSMTLLFIAISCSDQNEIDMPGPVAPEGSDPVVTLQVRIPGLLLPSAETYGMPANTETGINELTLLAFQNANGVEQLKIKQALTAGDFTQVGNNLTATLAITQGKYDKIVLIANANAQANTLVVNTSGYTDLNNLVVTKTTGQWGTAAADYIPMSATLDATGTNGLDITNSRTFTGLKLTRMLAKVDIINAATGAFSLKNVYVYNTNKNGTIVADRATYGATPKRERLPVPVLKDATARGFDFAALSVANGTRREMKGEIYLMEAAKADMASNATARNSTRIVLYGQYGGQDYYYPVDFTYSTTAGSITKGDFMPVVRNHHYTFEITKVAGAGFATADAAMESLASNTNMAVTLHQIDDDFTDVYYDGKDYLAVNSTNVNIVMGLAAYNTPTADNTISVLTSAANFTIECYNADGTPAATAKMKPDRGSYAGNGSAKDAYLVANYTSTASTEFEGYLVVKAGALQSEQIPLSKLWCGKNGIPLAQTIGSNKYKTHRYPTGAGGASECWMVENSREGTGSSKGYGLDWNGTPWGNLSANGTAIRGYVNGFYYSWNQASQANNACPTGWALPTQTSTANLAAYVNVRLNTADCMWWGGTMYERALSFAGYMYQNPGVQPAWYSLDVAGAFWVSTNLGKERVLSSGLLQWNDTAVQLCSVRCVKN